MLCARLCYVLAYCCLLCGGAGEGSGPRRRPWSSACTPPGSGAAGCAMRPPGPERAQRRSGRGRLGRLMRTQQRATRCARVLKKNIKYQDVWPKPNALREKRRAGARAGATLSMISSSSHEEALRAGGQDEHPPLFKKTTARSVVAAEATRGDKRHGACRGA